MSDISSNLKKFIYSRVQNRYDAEDILQEVLIKIYNNIDKLKNTSKMHAWIFRIAKNTIIDYYRGKHSDKKFNEYIENNIEDIVLYELLSDEITCELTSCLYPMVDKLPEKYKQAILLTELGELNQKELALSFGLSESGAKSRVQRGRVMLKDMFLQCCQFEFDSYGNVIEMKQNHENNFC